jgi:putative ABC transport system substrate-binding protein
MSIVILARVAALIAATVVLPLGVPAYAQKVQRIGVLAAVPIASHTREVIDGYRRALRDLGHVEGRNVAFEYRFADAGLAQLPALAAELVALKVDLILADTSDATRAAQQATTTIPIVMAVSAAPDQQGFVASLARPGGNITGLSMLAPELGRKRLELIKEVVPKAKRVAILGAEDAVAVAMQVRDLEVAARQLDLELVRVDVRFPDADLAGAFAKAAGADALIVIPDVRFARAGASIVALAAERRLPVMYFVRLFVEAGGLMSYGPDIGEMFRQAAGYTDRILRGAKPGDLPVQQPTKYDFVVNLSAAQALGITIPPTVLSRADDVVR